MGDIVLEYAYNDDGDLIRATDQYGGSRTISYDENKWIERIEKHDETAELVSSIDYRNKKNGRLDMHLGPDNVTHSLVHDRLGNVISVQTDGGLPETSVELPYGRRKMLGDEVSL